MVKKLTHKKLRYKLVHIGILWVLVLLTSYNKDFNKNSNYLIKYGAFKDCTFTIHEQYDDDDYQILVKCHGEPKTPYRATYWDLVRLMYRI